MEAFAADMEATLDRYIQMPLPEVDWDQVEAETRLVVAAHFPPHVKFQAHYQVETTYGPVIELLVTERGAVRYEPWRGD